MVMRWCMPGALICAAAIAAGCGDNGDGGGAGGAGGTGGQGGGTTTTGGGGGAGGGVSFPPGVCGDACSRATTVPTCPEDAATCMESCESTRTTIPWCGMVVDALLTCASQQPDSSFTCDDEMNPVLVDGVCSAEGDAIVACYFEGPPGGLPSMTSHCTASCDAQAGLPCASPTCVDECLAGVADAEPCNGAVAALVYCTANDPAATWSCDPQMKPTASSEACMSQVFLLLACSQQQQP